MADEFMYELKIPYDRVAVLIGLRGKVKKEIEAATKTKLSIDSKEGDIFIKGADAIQLFTAKEVIKAIGRGFNPEIALQLLKQDVCFELILMDDFMKNKNQHARLKGRVIGKEGSSRRNIEELTETYICVYGKTIGIIGSPERVSVARRAVESLLSGSPHSTVYKWLEKQRRELKIAELEGKGL
ncbi:RNA-processing protein [Candidatus Woesearchaeota archaeon]|nr:RNA-processing protein [Candidatus Woesearchaeota archaeon]